MTTVVPVKSRGWIGTENVVLAEDLAVHDWYRFVLSFPPHLVRDYLEDFDLGPRSVVFDPFCGTGTTLVEAKLRGLPSVGTEAAPMAHFASAVKTEWRIDPEALTNHASVVAKAARRAAGNLRRLRSLPPEADALLLTDSISPRPLHRAFALLKAMKDHYSPDLYDHERLALASLLPTEIGNLRFDPEVGLSSVLKDDAPVVDLWLGRVAVMARDLAVVRGLRVPAARALRADAREVCRLVNERSVDAVFTSPPYPNEKDYTRTTRLESVLLGFFSSLPELRAFKKSLVRSNTRGVYKDDSDDRWVENNQEIQRIAEAIEDRRVELGKTSGFARQYARVTNLGLPKPRPLPFSSQVSRTPQPLDVVVELQECDYLTRITG